MFVFLIICLVLLAVCFALVLYRDSKIRKEVLNMNMDTFKEKSIAYIEKKDGEGFARFIRRNFVFILRNKNEVEKFIKSVQAEKPVDEK